MYSRGYGLSLSDGNNWWVTGDEDNIRWIDDLTAILELKECAPDDLPKLIFSKMDDTGWEFYDHRIVRIWYRDSTPDIVYEVKDWEEENLKYINMRYSLHPIYQRSISKGGLAFHAALAELDGRGVLLSAPGDTGKSTCCRRLPDYWKPLCDDESLVVLNEQKMYRAHPFPTWTDYLWKRAANTWDVQYSVRLAGVFFLEQSETDEVVPIGNGEAAILMAESATQACGKFWRGLDEADQRTRREEAFSNACAMAKAIPAFRLRVSLHGRFWEEIEKALEL